MATISSAGIGSGIDVETLISRLVAAERTPITQLQRNTDGLKTQLSAFGKLQSQLSTLRDAATKLTRADTFTAATVAAADATVTTATATAGAAAGAYTVNVNRLAAAQSLASNAIPSGTGVGAGTMTITFGRYNDDLSSFDTDPTRTSLVIPIISGQDQLEKVRDQINALKAGIVASVVSDVNGSRLVMRGSNSGQANGFKVEVSDADGNNTDGSGLSSLAYDPTAGVNPGLSKQAALNARVNIDGIDIESATNEITGAIEGVTLNLRKAGASTTVNVGQDKEAIKKAITDFVTAYNGTITLLREQSRVDPATRGGGPLKGDSTVNGIQFQLRALAGASTTLGGSLDRLAAIGLEPQTDGTLKVDNTKLDAALGNSTSLRALFAGEDTGNASNSGLALQFKGAVDTLLNTDGRLDSRQKGIQSRISNNDKRGEELERRLSLMEKRLRQQYTALDATMSKSNNLAAYVNQQFG
ncbi:MAG: flagellar filament capping protein FliD [Inhella sp.]|jgi:flagellar hook-associated protein 2|uniref:flagellar filament capping protein FliD n=1 Tax=Inhella sp. TaxID=1921806 RepID=UPI0022C37797|nr:flagellar filament capping protein FliD [Inhella sp.]MCZ8234530.1 flagellar filament capping protein FliD [Inhella sp.]